MNIIVHGFPRSSKSLVAAFFVWLLSLMPSFSQEKITLSGTVSDATSRETLIGANVYIRELGKATATNEYGFFSLSVPAGTYTVQVSFVGFATFEENLTLRADVRKDYALAPGNGRLDEVVVTDSRARSDMQRAEMSTNKLTVGEIKKMPVVLGETDVLKAILQLPGVTNAGEGASGFNVRGGAADQNLVLLDEATLFNSSHLFGFFSVFNADAIKDLKLYKGGIPARFGGRVSSVLDIYQKEGNRDQFHISGGIGLISSRLLAEGTLVKGKGSFLVGGRASYAHLFLKLSDNKNSAYFYDLNAKLSYELDQKNRLYLSAYFGRDVFNINESFSNTYGNAVTNLRWNHLFSDRLFSNMSLIYSDYYYGLQLEFIGFNWDSGIRNYNLKYDFKHYISDKLRLNYGFNGIYYDFNPGEVTPLGATSAINATKLDRKYAFEPAFYIGAEQDLTGRISVAYGLRYSMFYRLGAQDLNTYADDQPVHYDGELDLYEKAEPTGTVHYGQNDVIARFGNFEPRLAVSFKLDDSQSVKVSYNRMAQYLHLISNTSSPTPLDVWAPSGRYIRPQLLDQVAAGYFRNFSEDRYTLEAEGFYKKVKNRIDYIDGADLIANNAIEQVVLRGRSRAYGLEMLLRKNSGALTGWIAYTLSRSEQQTPGRNAAETGINDGNWYKSGYDKLHDVSVTANYELNKKWTFGAIFNLQSGQPVTYPNGYYQYGGLNVPSYGARNDNRLPAYHHLDLSATLTPGKNEGRRWKGEWVFSVYNLYNRQNAASISFRQNEDTGSNEAVRLSIFGVIPSVTYNFKF